MTYPSGGNYPETQEDYAEHLLRLFENATPQQLNGFTQFCLKSKKNTILLELLSGGIDIDEANRRMDALDE
jgi:hypothetical protein